MSEHQPSVRRQFVWRHRVRFVDTDASGRIHYTAMLRFFEAAENEYLRALGVDYARLEDRHTSFPRVYVDCNYTGAVRDDDMVDIAVQTERVGSSSFTLAFRASVDTNPAAHGRIVIVCMNVETQKAQALPQNLAAILRGQTAASEAPPTTA